MNILIVSHYFPPFNVVASLRPYSWARTWADLGHQVTVLTTKHPARVSDLMPDYTGYEVIQVAIPLFSWFHRQLNEASAAREIPSNLRKPRLIRRLATYLQKRYGIFITARMPDICDLWIAPALAAVAGRHFDLVVSTSGPYACHLIARCLKSRTGVRWVADFRDLWTEGHIFPGLFPFTILERWLEANCLRDADMVTTVSKPLAATLKATGLPKSVYVVENGFNPDDLTSLSPEPFWPPDGKCRLVYTGTIYDGKQDPSPLFAAIQYLQETGYEKLNQLELIFATKQSEIVRRYAEKYGVQAWIRCLGYVGREDALRMQRDAHALLFLEFKDNATTAGILTGKIFEYLASGTEIWGVGTDPEDSVGTLILEAKVGRCMGKSVHGITEAIIELLERGEKQKVTCAPEILIRYDRQELARRMLLCSLG